MTRTTGVIKGMPEPVKRRGRPPKYPWEELEVGDSFIVKTGEDQPQLRSVKYVADLQSKRLGRLFVTAQLDSGEYQVYRSA